MLRGRAAQPLRPGLITKAVLLGDIPLRVSKTDPGKMVREAAVTDIHSTYKVLTQEENITRPRDKKLRGMSYASFITMFRFARCLGLVEKVREEPLLFPPPDVTLLSIRKPDDVPEVVESKRVIYRLTRIGTEDELAWTNLRRAWAEHWPVPQKAIEEIPLAVPAKPPVVEEVPIVAPPVELKMPKLAETPSIAQFKKLLAYLKWVRDTGISGMALTNRLDAMSGYVGDWDMWIGDLLEDAREAGQKSKIAKLTFWSKHIKEAVEGFLDEDLLGVIGALEKLT